MSVKFYDHPEYTALVDKWQTYTDLYVGDHDVLVGSDYLWPHQVERAANGGNELRAIRAKLSRYLNLFEPIVSTYSSICFKKPPTLDPETIKMFGEEELNNVDGNGKHLFTFIKEDVLRSLFLYGKIQILTDSYGVKAQNKLEERDLGLRPYFEMLNPLEVHDWQTDESNPLNKGQLEALRIEYQVIEPRTSLEQQPKLCAYVKTLDNISGVYTVRRYKATGAEKGGYDFESEAVISDWDRLPVASFVSDSWVKDLAEIQLRIFNTESWYDTALHFQAYQRLYVAGNVSDTQKKALTAYTLSFLPEGAVMDAVQPADLSGLERRVNQLLQHFYRVAFNRTVSMSSDSKEAPGADTLRQGKEELIDLLKASVQEIESVVNVAIQHYAKFKTGKDNFAGKIHLNTDITIESLDEQIALYQAHADDIKKVGIWHKEILKKAAERQNLPEYEKIIKEIDKTEFKTATPTAAATLRTKITDRLTNAGPDQGQNSEGDQSARK